MSSILLRQLLLSVALLLHFEAQPNASAQGKILFTTRVFSAQVDAQVIFATTAKPVSSDFSAQLYAAPLGSPLADLIPNGPILPFSTRLPGYIFPGAEVELPDFRIGQNITVVMKAFNGSSWETSSIRGESQPFDTYLGSIDGTSMTGLKPFTVDYIPEPGTVSIFCIGAAALVSFGLQRRQYR